MNVDVAIIGVGLGGLAVALSLATSRKVALICKRGLFDSASDWARGGIAVVLDSADSTAAASLTVDAGAGLCDDDVTRTIVE